MANFPFGLGEEDHAWCVKQGGEQQVLHAAGIQQPDGVDQRDGRDDQVLVPVRGILFVAFATQGQ
ncbi:hypothetical protein D3C85_1784420 [compost metagenome]